MFLNLYKDTCFLADGSHVLVCIEQGEKRTHSITVISLARTGISIIISPLKSMITNRLYVVDARGLAAGALHSGVDSNARKKLLRDLKSAQTKIKMLFITPELVGYSDVVSFIETLDVQKRLATFILDEGHIVSDYTPDYREEYAQPVSELRAKYPNVNIIAFTSFQTPYVIKDVVKRLHFRQSAVILKSPAIRPNIVYEERNKDNLTDPLADLLTFCLRSLGIIPDGRHDKNWVGRSLLTIM